MAQPNHDAKSFENYIANLEQLDFEIRIRILFLRIKVLVLKWRLAFWEKIG